MTHTKIVTENNFEIFVKSMRKLHKVTHLAFSVDGHNALFKKDIICVAQVPKIKNVNLMAEMYAGDTQIRLSDLSSMERPFTGMYVKGIGRKYFQVAGVFEDVSAATDFLAERPDTAPIDTVVISPDRCLHVIASAQPANVA